MSTISRKQREIADREGRILDLSRGILIHEGYHGLRMDRIATELEYSKGTIYNHFSCKEEIILALAVATMQTRSDLFDRASSFVGLPRERMLAVGFAAELFIRLFPEHFQVEQVIRAASIWDKTSEKRRNLLRSCEQRCMSIVAGIVRDAVARQDLSLPKTISAEDLVFGLWSMTNGAFLIGNSRDSLAEVGIQDAFNSLRLNQHRLLDGYHWQPLSVDMDDQALGSRIQCEVFPDEFRQLELG